MSKETTVSMNLAVPNLISICVDEKKNGEIMGRMYHYYSREPARFSSVVELMQYAERLFDRIAYPQASTKSRSFRKETRPESPYNLTARPERKQTAAELSGQRGCLATLLTRVEYRQNSTWQGEALWLEENQKARFHTELELMELLKRAMKKE